MTAVPERVHYLQTDKIHVGDARDLLPLIEPESVALSVWSPPYHVGKTYEQAATFEDWNALLSEVIGLHFRVLTPGGFLVVNIADILAFKDPSMPKIQALNPALRKHAVTRDDILTAMEEFPSYNRHQLADHLGVSEQTVDRRLNGNNIRGGKHSVQTRVRIVGGLIEEMALKSGLFPYDRRIWVKDPAWRNSRWANSSYRSVDEFEYIYIFWKPGVTRVDRTKLTEEEWAKWGARGVWKFPSVRSNDIHEAMFPIELPRRCIRLLTQPGETVLDCFMGSGTTAMAAIETGRHYIGIELLASTAGVARRRLEDRGHPRLPI